MCLKLTGYLKNEYQENGASDLYLFVPKRSEEFALFTSSFITSIYIELRKQREVLMFDRTEFK